MFLRNYSLPKTAFLIKSGKETKGISPDLRDFSRFELSNFLRSGEFPQTLFNLTVKKGGVCLFFSLPGHSFQDPRELMQFVEKDKSDISRRRYVCNISNNFFHQSKSNVRNYVECKHFPDSFVYNCEFWKQLTF
jgi:hypothetical protein